MRYFTNEGFLDLPDNWHDRSVNVLLPTIPDVPGCNLVLTRDDLPYGAEFSDYINVQKAKFKRELIDLQMHVDQSCEVDGRVAHYLEFNWQNDRMRVYQLALIVLDAPAVLTFTYTSPGQLPAHIRDAVGHAVINFRFRQKDD
ncbi:DUF1795 domain-containing protein [Paraburkholderia diazotrophica]|uniref:DUF1795 domain-containing protein n=1 Tax=Paraburkholderia diazotrophica TaxID=667676 RepID=UPI00316BAD85